MIRTLLIMFSCIAIPAFGSMAVLLGLAAIFADAQGFSNVTQLQFEIMGYAAVAGLAWSVLRLSAGERT